MLRQTVNCLKYRILPQIRNQSTHAQERTKWDLLVGVQIERLPIITKTLTKLERDYQELLWQLEYENSYKNDFEVRMETEAIAEQLLKEGKIQIDLDAVAKQTALDAMDQWKMERSKFQPAPRITDADKSNDLKSIDRKLDHSLTLLIEQQLGDNTLFLLPQGKIVDGETLYDTAQRVIKESCGDAIQATVYGKAPCGFYKYKYPKEVRGGSIGAKVFFYRAILRSGNVDAKRANYEWLAKDELFARVDKHSNYKKSLSKFII